MRVSKRGQITIPRELREGAGLLPGTKVDLSFDGHAVMITRAIDTPIRSRGRAIVDRLRGRGDVPLTTDEILKLTRG